MRKATDRELALFFALSNPLRVEICQQLVMRETSVTDLSEALGVKHSRISQELAILRNVKLVSSRTDGRLRYYSLEERGLKPIIKWLGQFKVG